MNHYVYRITCKTTQKHYYGVRSSERDPKIDLQKYKSSSSVVHQQIKVYGIENFKFKVVRILNSRHEAMALECVFHEKFKVDSNPSFMNLSRNRTTRAYFSAPGPLNYFWGKKMMFLDHDIIFVGAGEMDEFKQKGYLVGRPEWLKQHRHGSQNAFYGKKHTKETKEKISEFRSKPIRVFFKNGNVVEFSNRNMLGPHLGMSVSLGASLVSSKRTHLFVKYGIESVEVVNEYILHKEG